MAAVISVLNTKKRAYLCEYKRDACTLQALFCIYQKRLTFMLNIFLQVADRADIDADEWDDDGDDAFMREFRAKRLQGNLVLLAGADDPCVDSTTMWLNFAAHIEIDYMLLCRDEERHTDNGSCFGAEEIWVRAGDPIRRLHFRGMQHAYCFVGCLLCIDCVNNARPSACCFLRSAIQFASVLLSIFRYSESQVRCICVHFLNL